MCAPAIIPGVISSVASGVGGIMQTNAANATAVQQYQQQLKIRKLQWEAQRAGWNNRVVDYKLALDSNQDAAGRAWASEQYKLNEQFQDAAFRNQDMVAQLVQAQGQLGASEQTGRTAQRLQMEQLAAFGRNNAIMAESLASARGATAQRNEGIRQQMISANNQAWSNVSMAPMPDMAPAAPQLQGYGSSVVGMLGGLATAAVPAIWPTNVAPTAFTGNTSIGIPNSGFSTNWAPPSWNTSSLNFGIKSFV